MLQGKKRRSKTKEDEGDGNKAALAFFFAPFCAATNKKEEGDGVAVITFLAVL
jgi:hypothetical protein